MHKHTVKPSESDNFVKAEFDFCLPDSVKTPKFILILLTGYNGDSSFLCEDPQWLAFAEEINAAIIACTFQSGETNLQAEKHYSAAQYGSGAALDKAIAYFNQDCPGLKELKLLVYGHSAGGQFAYGYSCQKPEKMLGFAAGKGGYYFPEPTEQTYRVPGLLISGAKDQARRRFALRKLFQSHRKHGAPWCILEDNAGHEVAETVETAIAFFRGLINNNTAEWFHLQSGEISQEAVDKNPDYAFSPAKEFLEIWRAHGSVSPEIPEV